MTDSSQRSKRNSSNAIDSLSTLTMRWHSCGTAHVCQPKMLPCVCVGRVLRTEELDVLVGKLAKLRA